MEEGVLVGSGELKVIRQSIEDHIGNKVRLTSKKGKKKAVVRLGVIESTYPSIFVVRLDHSAEEPGLAGNRRVSYSYTDVLTKAVEVAIYAGKKDVKCS